MIVNKSVFLFCIKTALKDIVSIRAEIFWNPKIFVLLLED